MATPHVVVIGAGIVGLSTAVRVQHRLLQRFGQQPTVTVIADRVAVATTSHGAAGLWEPYYVSNTPSDDLVRWGGDTFSHLQSLYHSPAAAESGTSCIVANHLHREAPGQEPAWMDVVPNFRTMTDRERAPFGPAYQHGWCFTTYVVEAAQYLPFLQQQFQALGGALVTKRVESLSDVNADVVVNCGGLLGGVELAGDQECFPIRGQVVWLDAPWVQQYVCGDGFYAIPNRRQLVCGGVSQKGDWTTAAREEEVQYILDGVARFLPSITGAPVLGVWAGLRPGRSRVRLEVEQREGLPPVVHNYGHGGSGHTLHWGCAGEAAEMVMQCLGSADHVMIAQQTEVNEKRSQSSI